MLSCYKQLRLLIISLDYKSYQIHNPYWPLHKSIGNMQVMKFR